MKLSQSEVQSPLWVKISNYYSSMLVKYRGRLENPRIEERERLELCWRIYEIKNLLMLAEFSEPTKKVADAS